jgi:cytoskeletal protein RodZ
MKYTYMKKYTQGFSSIVLVVVIVILAIIAYAVFTKTTHAPEEEILLEETQTENIETTQTTSQKTTNTETITKTSATTQTPNDTELLESDLTSMESEIEDFKFEDLGIE